jgi:predicted GNAT superfamily acetyltransferase
MAQPPSATGWTTLVDRIVHRGDRFGRPLWYAWPRRTLALARLPASPVAPAMPLDLDRRTPRSAGTVAGTESVEHAGVSYRAFATHDDAVACVELQGEIWGSEFDRVPASLIKVAAAIGGLAIGAFDASGTLVGFVFSLAGMRDGQPIHWSHMLGVREDVRGMGVGRHLKELQRQEIARRGIARVLWTFDPLQARNAHLNFNRLGVRVVDYVENMYGITASPLHHGLATDRLVVMMPTTLGNGTARPAWHENGTVPVLTPFPRPGDILVDLDDTPVPAVLIEIPYDLQDIIARAPDVAGTWRQATRSSFLRAIKHQYDVVGLKRDLTTNRAFYELVASNAD